jgi:hypothetical protein
MVLGFFVWYHMGNILLSAWDVITHCQSAVMGEAIACLQGLKLGMANSSSNLLQILSSKHNALQCYMLLERTVVIDSKCVLLQRDSIG